MIARLFLALVAPFALSAATLPDDGIAGVWSNPRNTVHIRYEPCGRAMCGTVVWASDKAIADARRGGTDNLIGTQIFRNLYKAGANKWRGKVFVPDINKTFSGTVTIQGDRMIGRGCLVLGVGCRAQTWTRVE